MPTAAATGRRAQPDGSPNRRLKILVTGSFNAGKTQFVRSASSSPAVTSERPVTDAGAGTKEWTTVALDFGRVESATGNQLFLFGTPGQDRFAFDREVLCRGARGAVLMVDAGDRARFGDAREMAGWLAGKGLPYVVAANKQDGAAATSAHDLGRLLGLDERIAVIGCCATRRESVLSVLTTLEREICAKRP